MPRPEITGSGVGLRPNGTSNLWIKGNNIERGDIVEIRLDGELIYTGGIVNSRGDLYHAQIRPTRKGVNLEKKDLEDISITVTNEESGETSDPREDEVIIDAP